VKTKQGFLSFSLEHPWFSYMVDMWRLLSLQMGFGV